MPPFVAIAAARAAQADVYRSDDRFRPLTEGEAEAIVGAELLATLGGARRRA